MHSHNVYFWLKEGLTGSEIKEFEQGLQSLVDFPLVIRGLYGKPADTHRPVVERSYSYGLLLSFKDLADHDTYQAGPVHLAFVEKNGPKWVRAQVFDIET
jgi:Stress responsive A/B Barrel Domain